MGFLVFFLVWGFVFFGVCFCLFFFFFLAFLCSIIFYFVLILCFLDPISLLKEKPKKLVSFFFLPAVCGSKDHPTLGIFPPSTPRKRVLRFSAGCAAQIFVFMLLPRFPSPHHPRVGTFSAKLWHLNFHTQTSWVSVL